MRSTKKITRGQLKLEMSWARGLMVLVNFELRFLSYLPNTNHRPKNGLLTCSHWPFFIVGIAYLLSGNRKKIDWRLVGIGLVFQLVIGLAIAKVGFVRVVFEFISDKFVTL